MLFWILQEHYALDDIFCNQIGYKHGYMSGRYIMNVPFWGKQKVVEAYARSLGYGWEDIVFVGDSLVDVECLMKAGLGWEFAR